MNLGSPLKALSVLAGLKLNQWKSRDELESVQEERLLKLLSHARSNVPFYRKSLSGACVRSLEGLGSLPVLEKRTVADCPESLTFRALGGPKMHMLRTSGSTGTPLTLYFDDRDGLYGSTLRFHTLTECGFRPSDILANLSSTEFLGAPFQRLFYRIGTASPHEGEERLLLALRAMRANSVFAFPSTLSLLADRNRIAGKPLALRLAISCSEFLSQPARSLISGSFGCEVRNYYGSSESWSLGFECEKGSLHLNSDSAIMEIVDDDGMPQKPGKAGHVLVTSLWRYSMPFIRYRIGDMASFGKRCGCGRGLHVISSLDGRRSDYISLPSGRRISWASVQMPLCEVPGLVRFQCVQAERGRLRIYAIPQARRAQGSGKACENAIRKAAASALPEAMEIEIAFVDSIPRTGSGKMRDFISRIRPPHGE